MNHACAQAYLNVMAWMIVPTHAIGRRPAARRAPRRDETRIEETLQ